VVDCVSRAWSGERGQDMRGEGGSFGKEMEGGE
jgi:hypothetical protein